jgi:hypothetical protein
MGGKNKISSLRLKHVLAQRVEARETSDKKNINKKVLVI